MNNQQHIIKQHIFEIHIPDHIDYHKLKDLITGTLERLVYPKLGLICDQHSKQDINNNINRLEIDLGKLSLTDVKSVLIEQLPKKFETALISFLAESGTTDQDIIDFSQHLPARFSNIERDIQAIKHFLNTGTLPWWQSSEDKKSIVTMLLELGREDTDKFKYLLLNLNRRSWHRLFIQHNNYQLLSLVKNLRPSFSENIIALYQDIQKIFCYNIGRQLSASKLRFHFWLFIFSAILQNLVNLNEISYINELIRYLASVFNKKNPDLIVNGVKDTISNLLQKDVNLHSAIISWATKEEDKKRNQLGQLFGDHSSNQNKLQNIISNIDFEDTNLNATYTPEISSIETVTQTKLLQNRNKQEVKTNSAFRILPLQDFDSNLPDFNEIYIDNAGIILYWVYLKDLFNRLGLVKKNSSEFNNMRSTIRASILLNLFAFDNLRKLSEEQFALNKILCDLPLEYPISNSLRVKSTEAQAFEDLNYEIIRSWPALGKITIKGFRDAFILRNGVLKNENSQWLLHIEKKPQDVLLKKLPWSINVIKLPWMKKYIIVEW